ncbi:MAG: glycosyltransferase [Aestuariivirga sp.]
MAYFLLLFSAVMLAVHLVTQIIVLRRKSSQISPDDPATAEAVTIVRPISQIEPHIWQTLESTFQIDWPNLAIVFCAARESDPAVTVVRALLDRHPDAHAQLLLGESRISDNPKLNNCVKGWTAARTDVVAFVDSNVLLPRDYLKVMMACWDEETGMISVPAVGAAPGSFWAETECAILNTHQARWQLVADTCGMGFAQGKNLMFRKSVLDPLGGIAVLAHEPAEDAAATKAIRQARLCVRLAPMPFPQPLGAKTFRQVWNRHLRWAKLRRATFPLQYLPEFLTGSVLPFTALVSALLILGIDLLVPALVLAAVWFGSELVTARRLGWHVSPWTPVSLAARDLLLPVLWIAGFSPGGFEWQGHAMSAQRSHGGAAEAEHDTDTATTVTT